MRFVSSTTSLLCACVLALSACGGGGSGSGGASGPAAFAPADTPIYFEATIRPQGDQKVNAEALLTKLGDLPLLGSQIAPEALAAKAVQQFNAVVGANIDYVSDVKPWLGSKAGLAITSIPQATVGTPASTAAPTYVLAVETTDDDAARAALAKIAAGGATEQKEYDGVPYYESAGGMYDTAVLDGMLVLASDGTFQQAVDAERGGDSLASSGGFEQAFAPLVEGGLGAAYIDFDRSPPLSKQAAASMRAVWRRREASFPSSSTHLWRRGWSPETVRLLSTFHCRSRATTRSIFAPRASWGRRRPDPTPRLASRGLAGSLRRWSTDSRRPAKRSTIRIYVRGQSTRPCGSNSASRSTTSRQPSAMVLPMRRAIPCPAPVRRSTWSMIPPRAFRRSFWMG